ncbi:MFS transporter [Cytobacillus massiliigabonensis]|uniref:MFS transporter n=1 Tax=Cytobacillus massiliigabonensis TaxID=1871011 RepID=UPI0015E0B480|nr:MFS transporter [Cytobacillus massiliigabonensis]
MLLKNNRAFRNLFVSRVLSILSDSVIFFSLLKWIEIQSNSSSAFTLFYVAFYLPMTLFAIPIGAWIENKTLQKVMGYSNFIQVIMLVLFLVTAPFLAYQWVYLLLVILSILGLFFIPANQSLLPHIVEEENRAAANSLLQLGFTAVKIVGQVFTALMIKLTYTPSSLLIISVCMLLVSLIFIKRVKPIVKKEQMEKQSQWKVIRGGISYIGQHSQLKPLFTFLALAMFFAASIDLLLITFLNDVLSVGVENLSFIGTASLLGIALGAMVVPKLYKKIERKWLVIPPLFALSVSIGSLFFVTNWVVILPLFFLQGIALGCFNVSFVTYLQEIVSKQNYTRTFSFYNMISSSMALPGIFIVGIMIDYLGVLTTIIGISGVLIIIGILGIYFIPKLGKGYIKESKNMNAV